MNSFLLPDFSSKNQNLVDPSGRWLHKLRVQLTDACNFRCFYCMPQNPQFLPHSELLSVNEYSKILSILNSFGVDEVRLTGGEPTFRKDFSEVLNAVSDIPFSKIGITTNGFLLHKHFEDIRKSNVTSINISLDSLKEDKFNKITKGTYFKQVMKNILQARDFGLNVKINCVMFSGVNIDEVLDFVVFSEREKIEVRFLEYMKIGVGAEDGKQIDGRPGTHSYFFSAQMAIEAIEQHIVLISTNSSWDSTSFGFRTLKGGKIGFIASESQAFCATCSRLRLTAKGVLRACLMSEKGMSLRGLEEDEYPKILKQVGKMKPVGRIEKIMQPMNEIGG